MIRVLNDELKRIFAFLGLIRSANKICGVTCCGCSDYSFVFKCSLLVTNKAALVVNVNNACLNDAHKSLSTFAIIDQKYLLRCSISVVITAVTIKSRCEFEESCKYAHTLHAHGTTTKSRIGSCTAEMIQR